MEKLAVGNPNGFAHINQLGQNDPVGEKDRSSKVIADQLSIGEKTVRRAAEFTLAVDKIVSVTGIKVNDLLDGKIKGTMEDIKTFADLEESAQKKIMIKAIAEKEDLSTATRMFEMEEMERRIREAEEKLRLEREEKEKQERERLRLEREEKVRQEKERLAKAREEQERLRLANSSNISSLSSSPSSPSSQRL